MCVGEPTQVSCTADVHRAPGMPVCSFSLHVGKLIIGDRNVGPWLHWLLNDFQGGVHQAPGIPVCSILYKNSCKEGSHR